MILIGIQVRWLQTLLPIVAAGHNLLHRYKMEYMEVEG